MDDVVYRQQAIDALCNDYCGGHQDCKYYPNCENLKSIEQLPSVQQEYEPVTAEDFAKTMSENTIWQFAVWHGHALTLMKEQGFVICKKAM